jgi:hypothetical protein
MSAGVRTALWIQQKTPLGFSGSGTKADRFGFTISGTRNLVVVMEVSYAPKRVRLVSGAGLRKDVRMNSFRTGSGRCMSSMK